MYVYVPKGIVIYYTAYLTVLWCLGNINGAVTPRHATPRHVTAYRHTRQMMKSREAV